MIDAAVQKKVVQVTWVQVVTLVAVLAALNGRFNWTSTAAIFLCLALLAIAVARYTNFKKEFVDRFGLELWHIAVTFVVGVVFALLVITAAEVYLAYLYSCSSEFKDTWSYKLCVYDYGPYYDRAPGHYAFGERLIIEGINSLYEYAHEFERVFLPLLFILACLLSFLRRQKRNPGETKLHPR